MNWSARVATIPDGRIIETFVERDGSPASFAEVLEAWRAEPSFRSWFADLLAAAPFEAFRWETPAATAGTVDRPFRFALIDAPELLRRPADPSSFADAFRTEAEHLVVDFPNLGRDAILIAPRPMGPGEAYASLAAFVRHAPDDQHHALWKAVAAVTRRRLGTRPVWLNTAGAGVPWLHVRLDDRPKYYAHGPYRSPA
ncbi:DUF6940 family protein [Paludisphaera soli]|uniref:DUF6940 family protein n=1 Tax=Paludisphaera soli TaxID=2712865 RepID=UPI0013EB35F6|nr:hypothetical protein [Paludisphaera soli]